MTQQRVIQRDSETLGETPVFRGTRVPVQSLLDDLAAGETLDQFLEDFPTVHHDQAVAALEEIKQSLLGQHA